MTDDKFGETAEDTSASSASAAGRSIALTTPILALAAGLIALAAFLLGYVVQDLGHDDRPVMGRVMIDRNGPGGGLMGGGMMGPDGDRKRMERVDAGTVQSVSGTTVTLKTPAGQTTKVKLGKGTFIVVRKASTQ